MKRILQVAMALMIALTILLSFVHPATAVLASRQAKAFAFLHLVVMAVFASVLPALVAHDQNRDAEICPIGYAGTSRIAFFCSFLC